MLVFSILNRNISYQNAMHSVAILPWFVVKNLTFDGAV
jgi:hypothetical protein